MLQVLSDRLHRSLCLPLKSQDGRERGLSFLLRLANITTALRLDLGFVDFVRTGFGGETVILCFLLHGLHRPGLQ